MERLGKLRPSKPNCRMLRGGGITGASFGLAALSLNAAVGLDLPGLMDLPDELNKSTLLVLLGRQHCWAPSPGLSLS